MRVEFLSFLNLFLVSIVVFNECFLFVIVVVVVLAPSKRSTLQQKKEN
jgi:uncharacterized membrane protein